MPEEKKSTKLPLVIAGAFLVIIILLALSYFFLVKDKKEANTTSNASTTPTTQVKKTTITKVGTAKKVFTGGYADPSILKKADGTYIMYLNKFGNGPGGYFALTSTDAENWVEKTGILFPGISVSRAFQTETGVRFYYPEQTPIDTSAPMPNILSALSTDGLSFTNDAGVRLTPRAGYFLGGMSVFKLKDGSLRMYFEEMKATDMMRREGAIWGASSTDGLVWTRDTAVTIEAEKGFEYTEPNWPQALHPYVVTKPDGNYLMFYNAHSEIFAAESSDGLKWTKLGKLDINGADSDGVFLPDGTFRLYYGNFSEQTSGEVFYIDLKIS